MNNESQLGRGLRRTFCRDPNAVLQRVTRRAPTPRQVEIITAHTLPIIETGPDSGTNVEYRNHFSNSNSDQQKNLIPNKSQSSGVTSVSDNFSMSGVSQTNRHHKIPQFNDEPSEHLGRLPSTDCSDSCETASITDRHDIPSHQSLQYFKSHEAKSQSPVESNDEQTTTDKTSTTSTAVSVFCPIMMNIQEVSLQTLEGCDNTPVLD